MSNIFNHNDDEGDYLRVTDKSTFLRFRVDQGDHWPPAVDVDRTNVQRLRNELTKWLGETIEEIATPPTADEELIQRIVSQAVTETLNAQITLRGLAHPADPEPHDVGHPVRPVQCGVCDGAWSDSHGQPGDPCTRPTGTRTFLAGYCECGHTKWSHDHSPGGCRAAKCTCKLNRTEVRGLAPAPKCTCVHPTAEHHAPAYGWDGGCTYCLCRWPGVQA